MNFPDPFEQPYEYWLMIVNAIDLNRWEKQQKLEAVGLDYDNPPSEAVA